MTDETAIETEATEATDEAETDVSTAIGAVERKVEEVTDSGRRTGGEDGWRATDKRGDGGRDGKQRARGDERRPDGDDEGLIEERAGTRTADDGGETDDAKQAERRAEDRTETDEWTKGGGATTEAAVASTKVMTGDFLRMPGELR